MTTTGLVITKENDPQDMMGYITDLPDQLARAWEMGKQFPLPAADEVRQVVIVGVGGSAIGADLASAYVQPICRVPVTLWRNYGIPLHARNAGTLVIFSSKSGNTEEVLNAFEEARDCAVSKLVVTTGGKLAARGAEVGVPVWLFDHPGEPRTAVGYSFGLLLALLQRLNVIPEQDAAIQAAVAAMKGQQQLLASDQPLEHNPARKLSQRMQGTWPVILASDFLVPVARRWRTQIAELAKALAQFEALPEGNHNMLEAVHFPLELHPAALMVFLQADSYHPRNLLRSQFTRENFAGAGLPTEVVIAAGANRLSQQWTSLHYGDYVAYYLALGYGIDPTPVQSMQAFKARLSAVS
ncbi:MAG: hypothetical protein JXA25_06160 [Anaerolineales bacterium]|nr:hypothetical protein [Anaerolineales bacterium]